MDVLKTKEALRVDFSKPFAFLPEPPEFSRVEDARRYRKERLAGAFRIFAHYGIDEGVAGHITARDPELTDHFWVNPFGMYFGHIRVSDLLLVNSEGVVIEGNRPVNDAAFSFHSAIHHARPDVVTACHAHSIYGKAWSSLGRLLDPITQNACTFYNDHVLFDDYTGIVFDRSEGQRVAEALGNNKAIILRNHGLLTVGQTVEEAVWWFIALEKACQVQLIAEAAGKPLPLSDEIATMTHRQIGPSRIGWLSCQPLYDMILRKEPDLLD